MILHDPVMRLGVFAIHPFGLFVAIGIVVGYLIALWRALRMGLHARYLPSMLIVVVMGGLVMARLEYVALHPETLRGGLADLLTLWRGGLTLVGGVAGGAVLLALYAWARREPFWSWADALAPASAVGLAIGMIGLPYTGEGWGVAATGPFFMHVAADNLPANLIGHTRFQPVFAYEALLLSALALLLFALSWRRQRGAGALGLTFLLVTMIGYGLLRPLTLDSSNGTLVVQTQLICAAAAAYAFALLLRRIVAGRAEDQVTRELRQAQFVARRRQV